MVCRGVRGSQATQGRRPLRFFLIFIPALLLIGTAAHFINKDVRRVGLEPGADDATFRNHRDMARFIDWLLEDEMVRPLLPNDKLSQARTLRNQYYGSKGTRN